MQQKTQAEIFIETLTQLVDLERDRERTRLRRRYKASAERYIDAFKADFADTGHPLVRAIDSEKTGQNMMLLNDHD